MSNEPQWTADTIAAPAGLCSVNWLVADDATFHDRGPRTFINKGMGPKRMFETSGVGTLEGNIDKGDAIWTQWFSDNSTWPFNTGCFDTTYC